MKGCNKRHLFRKKVIEHKMCFFFLFSLQLLSETLLSLRRNERDMIINMYWYSGTRFFYQNLMKLELFRQTNSYTIILKLHKHTKMANQAQFVKIVYLNHSVALVALCKQQDVTGASTFAHPSRHMLPHTVWNFRSYL